MAAAIWAMDSLEDRDYTFVDQGGRVTRLAYPELGRMARGLGAGLLEMGFPTGGKAVIISNDPFDSVRCLFACFVSGIVPVMVAPPSPFGDSAAYAGNLRRQLAAVGVTMALVDDSSRGLLEPFLDRQDWNIRLVPIGILREADPIRLPDADSLDAAGLALLQFTSGSGSDSKAVMISHNNLAVNSKAIYVDGIGVTPADRVISWLPLYHDMGLIGQVLSPVREGVSVTLIPTISFLKRPSIWMEAVSLHRGTIACAPNFAFGLACRARPARNLELGSLRVLGCGAEPIHAGTLRDFLERHKPFGLDASALVPCYGLAENTLAATFSPLGEGLVTEVIDANAYRDDGVAIPAGNREDGLEVVCCGRAFPGHGISILKNGTLPDLPDGVVGEIVLKGPSIAIGYLGKDLESKVSFPSDPSDGAKTLRTGDLGYLRNGLLFVTGRQKELIIINGRNFDPHHVETIVEEADLVRAGSAFAFSVPGPVTERLVILYETGAFPASPLNQRIRNLVSARLGLAPFALIPQRPHSLPKTTSGKKRRKAAMEAYLRGDIHDLDKAAT